MPKLVAMYSTLVIQANMLDVTRRSSHKWYARNGSHKLTACYKVYSAYKVRKKNCSRRTRLLHATAVRGYHVFCTISGMQKTEATY